MFLLNKIVVGDLESLITPDGKNIVYMAAWYNGTTHKIFNISQWGYNTNTMLEQFWIDLINNNLGKNCYFHNFGGYDAILSLPSLLRIPPYKFYPIMKDGEIISREIYLPSNSSRYFSLLSFPGNPFTLLTIVPSSFSK